MDGIAGKRNTKIISNIRPSEGRLKKFLPDVWRELSKLKERIRLIDGCASREEYRYHILRQDVQLPVDRPRTQDRFGTSRLMEEEEHRKIIIAGKRPKEAPGGGWRPRRRNAASKGPIRKVADAEDRALQLLVELLILAFGAMSPLAHDLSEGSSFGENALVIREPVGDLNKEGSGLSEGSEPSRAEVACFRAELEVLRAERSQEESVRGAVHCLWDQLEALLL
ncbi:hypothetical protein ACLOJK_007090 [Asimina triloba]